MRLSIIIATLTLTSLCSFGQESKSVCAMQYDSLTLMKVLVRADTMATVDFELLNRVVTKNLILPKELRETDISKIIIGFVVDVNGQIKGKRIIKNSKGTNAAQQLLTIVTDLKWRPGICNGRELPTLQIVPLNICK